MLARISHQVAECRVKSGLSSGLVPLRKRTGMRLIKKPVEPKWVPSPGLASCSGMLPISWRDYLYCQSHRELVT